MIFLNDFKLQYKSIKEQIDDAINKVLDSGWFVLGQQLEKFENEFANYLAMKYCVGVASGTDAITLSLMVLELKKNSEVITTNLSAFPTITGILQAGLKPVVVDINPENGLIDISKIEEKINSKTKVILPVHLYGQSCDMNAICSLANKYNLHVIEDCAQSVGSKYLNKNTGTFGLLSTFSFYPTKNLGAFGDAGAIATNDLSLYKQLLKYRNYGQTSRYYHDERGLNSRLDEIQAAILSVKLKYLDQWNLKRLQIANYYKKNINCVEFLSENDSTLNNYHLFVVKTKKRDNLIKYLNNNNIQALIHYPVPINQQKVFRWQKKEKFDKTVNFTNSIVSLPIYPELSDAQIEYIVSTVNKF